MIFVLCAAFYATLGYFMVLNIYAHCMRSLSDLIDVKPSEKISGVIGLVFCVPLLLILTLGPSLYLGPTGFFGVLIGLVIGNLICNNQIKEKSRATSVQSARKILNERGQAIHSARQILSDGRLIAFLHAASEPQNGGFFAFEQICKALAKGKSLDEIFYDGSADGFGISVEQISESDFTIAVQHLTGYLTNDGRKWLAGRGCEWSVSFTGDIVKSIKCEEMWNI